MTAPETTGSAPAAPQPGRPRFPRPSLVEWLCLAGGVLLSIHYAWLMDDAFIYFRYVDNLLYLGHGLVYNAGEYVEGFSSPLWAVLLVLGRATGLDFWTLTRILGVLAYVLFWALFVLLGHRTSGPGPRLNLPLVYLTFNYAVLCYWTSGLETPLVQVAAPLYALFLVAPRSRVLQACVAVTPMLRHELALPFLMAFAWLWFRERRFPRFLTLATFVLSGSWMLFRVWYYADVFPNTFYLKDQADFAQGLTYLADTTSVYHVYPVLGVLLVGFVVSFFTGRGADADGGRKYVPERLVMLAMALPILFYVVRIGGDPRHYRYLAFPFCLVLCAGSGVAERLLAPLAARARAVTVLVLGLALALGTASLYPRQLSAHPFTREDRHTIVEKINDASRHRYDERMTYPAWGFAPEKEQKERYAAHLRAHPQRPYVETITEHWCVTAYERFDARVVHSLGLTDPILARANVPTTRPAHKPGLKPLAAEMQAIIAAAGDTPRPNMYREAVEAGRAPRWIADNLETIEEVERKMFNQHGLFTNLKLAGTLPGKVAIPEERRHFNPNKAGPSKRRGRKKAGG
jgi:hypothetical protein